MGEHFTRNTLGCTAFCKKCQRFTQHRVDGGRKGPCIDPNHPTTNKAQEKRDRARESARQNPELFQ